MSILFNKIKELQPVLKADIEEILSILPYKLPKGYWRWDDLVAIAALHAYAVDDETVNRNILISYGLWKEWIATKAPLYCVSKERLYVYRDSYEFDREALSKIVSPGSNLSVPTFLLVFPDNSFKNINGIIIRYLLVSLEINNTKTKTFSFENQDNKIVVHTIDNDFNLWTNVNIIDPLGVRICDRLTDTESISSSEWGWLDLLIGIGLRAAIDINLSPVEDSEHSPKNKYIYPRWLK
jgi:hypothetical protein